MATRRERTPSFVCGECGHAAAKWVGQCDGCGCWNTIEAVNPVVVSAAAAGRPQALADIDCSGDVRWATGVEEFDRVLGGGLVAGSVVLMGGEPGIGKSTLLLQVLAGLAERGVSVLYGGAEESAAQVAQRAHRLGLSAAAVELVATTDVDVMADCARASGAKVLVVDSIQTVFTRSAGSAAGSVAQVRAATQALVEFAKDAGCCVVVVGHVTKDGAIAGPRFLEHLVDAVVMFEGDRYHSLRFLRSWKNRFGTTAEVGLLSMGESGLVALADPSGVFLADRSAHVAGSCVTAAVDGRRAVLVEVQALVAERAAAHPRRSVQGLDSGRIDMLLAVLDRRCRCRVAGLDVYALAVGGAKAWEPAVDLAAALAVASAATGIALPADVVAVGEVGLSGEVRQVHGLERRVAEALRLGFRRVVVPRNSDIAKVAPGAIEVATLADAVGHPALGLVPQAHDRRRAAA